MNGILVIKKEKGYTSRDVVNIVGNILRTSKIGHCGTLDPLATGVLVLALGKSTSLVEIMTDHDKDYTATMILGLETDTLDITGKVLLEEEVTVTEDQIRSVLAEMRTTYEQEVPIYSAVKIKGKKLYEYAREGKEIALPKRTVTIQAIDFIGPLKEENGHPVFSLRCTVSKGTYIRSLIRDIAAKLGTVGTMASLTRTRQGEFFLTDAFAIDDIKEGNYRLLPNETCLRRYPRITVTKETAEKIKNGILLPKEGSEDIVLIEDENHHPLALYKTYEKDITKRKPWKML